MMITRKLRTGGPLLLALILLTIGGCIISGTFMIVDSFSFTTQGSGIYYYEVDLTTEQEWKDHADKIDRIETVGFELWITNYESIPVLFQVYIDEFGEPQYTSFSAIQANTTHVLANVVLAPGPGTQTHISYADSFSHLMNVARLKNMVESGKMNFYGVSSGGTSNGYVVDSGKVIVTISAGV